MKPLRIHYFQHIAFKGLGCIEQWAIEKKHTLTATRFYETHHLPKPGNMDWLIIMGGPMSIYDEDKHGWLKDEKAFIEEAIARGKTVIGVCLGAQLIACVLGARVYPNAYKEIGWFEVARRSQGNDQSLLEGIEPAFTVFHWHGDTFELPEGAEHLLQSEACANQAFLYRNNVLGIQFHFEATRETLRDMVKHGLPELTPDTYIQNEERILAGSPFITQNNQRLYGILNKLEQQSI